MIFVSRNKEQIRNKNGFLGKSSFFLFALLFIPFTCLQSKRQSKLLVCLLILIQYMFFHISMNSQRKEKSTIFNDRHQYVQS